MDCRRFVILALTAVLVIILAPGSAIASEQTDAMKPVHQFIDGLNKGDTKMAVAACASPAIIIDDFPPHVWQGPTACADWASAFNTAVKEAQMTDRLIVLGTPWHVDVTGDRAYVVVPANFTFKLSGKPVTESGSILTVALKKTATGWLIIGWAWAKH